MQTEQRQIKNDFARKLDALDLSQLSLAPDHDSLSDSARISGEKTMRPGDLVTLALDRGDFSGALRLLGELGKQCNQGVNIDRSRFKTEDYKRVIALLASQDDPLLMYAARGLVRKYRNQTLSGRERETESGVKEKTDSQSQGSSNLSVSRIEDKLLEFNKKGDLALAFKAPGLYSLIRSSGKNPREISTFSTGNSADWNPNHIIRFSPDGEHLLLFSNNILEIRTVKDPVSILARRDFGSSLVQFAGFNESKRTLCVFCTEGVPGSQPENIAGWFTRKVLPDRSESFLDFYNYDLSRLSNRVALPQDWSVEKGTLQVDESGQRLLFQKATGPNLSLINLAEGHSHARTNYHLDSLSWGHKLLLSSNHELLVEIGHSELRNSRAFKIDWAPTNVYCQQLMEFPKREELCCVSRDGTRAAAQTGSRVTLLSRDGKCKSYEHLVDRRGESIHYMQFSADARFLEIQIGSRLIRHELES